MTNTIMLAENITAYQWAYVSGNHSTQYRIRSITSASVGKTPSRCQRDAGEHGRRTPCKNDKTYRKVNGQRVDNAAITFRQHDDIQPNYGFPSSNHPGGVNMAFCGGNVKFVTDEITPTVYAQLMTSNRKGSDLVDGPLREQDEAAW